MSASPSIRESHLAAGDESSAGGVAVWPRRRFAPANASHHPAIHDLLHTTYPAYSFDEFSEWLEEPTYDPADRLLLFVGSELVGHAHLVQRYANFRGVRLPIAMIREFAVSGEFDCEAIQAEMLARMEQAATERGAVAALLCGRGIVAMPDKGWHPLPRQGYSEADPQVVLSRLGESSTLSSPAARGPRVGLFRRMDLDGLMTLYAGETDATWGCIVRNEPGWQWLLGRRTHDLILVATTDNSRFRKPQRHPPLAGYAIAKRNHVLEVIPAGGNSGERLLGRLCRDAVDQGDHTVTLHTPADDPLHQLLLSAGGDWCDSVRPVRCKLLDRTRWVEALFPLWHQSLREQGLTPPCTLAIELPDRRCEIVVSRRSAHWHESRTTESPADIACDEDTFAALLAGLEDWQTARDSGRLTIAKPQAAGLQTTLFVERPWHFTLLDWM